MFRGARGYEVRSGGTDPGTRVRVKPEDVESADLIFAMEHKHIRHLQSHFKAELSGKRLICLEIPDKYGCMTPELMDALKHQLTLYLEVP